MSQKSRPINLLLIEDNPGDVRLTQEAFKEGKLSYQMDVVMDGVEAIHFLRRRPPYENAATPDIILLDLNLPKKDGTGHFEELRLTCQLLYQ